jgi:FtsP/CotA-like multicopper oxidase with cupredoxin domain
MTSPTGASPQPQPAAGPARPSSRRRLGPLGLIASLLGLGVAALLAGVFVYWAGSDTNTAGEVDFARPLAVPPLDEGTVGPDGVRRFDLRVQQGESDLGGARPTSTWGVNGAHLGPTLRAARGEQVAMTVDNDLPETTTLHWHGMHLPAAADGGPHQMVPPGRTWSPSWTIKQPAATLWYHPHLHGTTAEHVYRGVAGMFILDDPDAADGLPDRYGEDDVPLIVQDVSLDGDGQLDLSTPTFSPTGQLGDTVLVNGTPGPHLDVTAERTRLRLLNASVPACTTSGWWTPTAATTRSRSSGPTAACSRSRRPRTG